MPRTLILPSSSKCFVELDDTDYLATLQLRQSQLRLEQIAIRVEGVELRVHAAAIADVGQPFTIFKRRHQRLLMNAAFPHALMRDQSVRNLAKGGLNRFFILNQRAIPLGFRQFDIGLESCRR